jgi:hypothetical protein
MKDFDGIKMHGATIRIKRFFPFVSIVIIQFEAAAKV